MKRKLFLAVGLLVGTLGLASCGPRPDFEVVAPTKSEALKSDTPLDVDASSLSQNDRKALVKEQCFKAYDLSNEETLTGNLKTVRDNRKKAIENIANAKSFTTTCMVKDSFQHKEYHEGLGYFPSGEVKPMTLLFKSSMDFETGNLYYYEHAYFDSGEEIAKLETKAIRQGTKYVVACKINFAPGAYVIQTTFNNGGSKSTSEKEIKGELKVKTEIDATNVILGTEIDAQHKMNVPDIKANLYRGLLFNVQSFFSKFFDADDYAKRSVSVNEDYSTVYVEGDHSANLFENYLLKSSYIGPEVIIPESSQKITMNYELSDTSVVTDFETDLSDYKSYFASNEIFEYNQTSVFPLAREPYNQYALAVDQIGYGCYNYPISFLSHFSSDFK